MDIIAGLLQIKRIREQSREAEMRQARRRLEHAAHALQRARDLQQQRDRERGEHELSLYREVCSRVVVRRELDDLRLEVDAMKEKAKTDAQAVATAQVERATRRGELDEAAQSWQLASRTAQKFEDLSAEERQENLRHQEWLADLELEEHPVRNVSAEAMEATDGDH